MKRVTISKGGQISIPVEIRRRWGTDEVTLWDNGNSLDIYPVQDDVVARLCGIWKDPTGKTAAEYIREMRNEENRLLDEKWERSKKRQQE